MRALVFTAPRRMDVLDVADPVPSADEVVIDVEAVGICGSELHGISGAGWRRPPLVMGHEIVGVDPTGRRVAVNPLLACGSCDACARGQENLCRTKQLVGVQRPGGFAERVAVPHETLHDIPESLSWGEAALIEPLANAVHACRLVGPLGGARVAVIGAGALGLLCAAVAAQDSPAQLTVADPSAPRLAVATAVGADEVTSRLDGEFDVVIDAVGAPATRNDSIARLRAGGTAVWLGLAVPEVAIDGNAVVRDEKRVLGSFAYDGAEFAEAIALAPLTDLSWTTSVGIEESAAVFMELSEGRSDIVRAVIRPRS